jgi:hypothetical protein
MAERDGVAALNSGPAVRNENQTRRASEIRERVSNVM